MAHNSREVEIHLPLETLIETVCKLPPEDLAEIKRRITKRLHDLDPMIDDVDHTEFWDTKWGREILAEADPSVTREEVFRITSKIKGSLAADVIAEREER